MNARTMTRAQAIASADALRARQGDFGRQLADARAASAPTVADLEEQERAVTIELSGVVGRLDELDAAEPKPPPPPIDRHIVQGSRSPDGR